MHDEASQAANVVSLVQHQRTSSFENHVNLATIHRRNGRLEDAVREWQRAAALNPTEARVRLDLGMAMLDMGSVESAFEHLSSAVDLDPGLREAVVQLGWACHRQGDVDAAIRHWQEALRLDAGDHDLRLTLVEGFLEQFRYRKALHHLERVLKDDPTHVEAMNLRGQTWLAMGEVHDAVAELRACLQLDPSYARGHLTLGQAYRHLGWVDAAMLEFRRASKLEPTNRDAMYHVSETLASKGDLVEARAAALRTLEAWAGDVPTLLMLASMAESVDAWDEAENRLLQALPHRDAHAGLGRLYLKLGRFEAAVEAFQGALASGLPRSSDMRLGLASAHLALGKTAEALTEIRGTLAWDPERPEAHVLLGDVYQSQGRIPQARTAWRKALKLNPESSAAKSRLQADKSKLAR